MADFLLKPWPWFVSGPLIGLMVPFLLISSNKSFGISSNLKHVCAMIAPPSIKYFKYNWKKEAWNMLFVLGVILGGYIATTFFSSGAPIELSSKTVSDLRNLGITDFNGFMPVEIFSYQELNSLTGTLHMIIGGLMVGFGTRYAEGCTSGHAITGLSMLQKSSLIAVIGFFIGGLMTTHLFYPLLGQIVGP